jgi:hypothetical protein
MRNGLDNPMDTRLWPLPGYIQGGEEYMPDFFSSILLDRTNGDLYVIMYGYNRVTKYSLN